MRLCLGVLLAALGSGQDIAFQLTRIHATPVALQPPPEMLADLFCTNSDTTSTRIAAGLRKQLSFYLNPGVSESGQIPDSASADTHKGFSRACLRLVWFSATLV